jgi:hypothetical protein
MVDVPAFVTQQGVETGKSCARNPSLALCDARRKRLLAREVFPREQMQVRGGDSWVWGSARLIGRTLEKVHVSWNV